MPTSTDQKTDNPDQDYYNDKFNRIAGGNKPSDELENKVKTNPSSQLPNQEAQAESTSPKSSNEEIKDLFKPNTSNVNKATSILKMSKKQGGFAGLALGIVGIVFLYFAFIGSGPAQLLHAAEWLKAINFTDQEIDADVRLSNLSIYSQLIKNSSLDGIEKTRLGYLASKHASKLDLRLQQKGFVGNFSNGKLVSYSFDKSLIPDDGEFSELKNLDGDELRNALANKLGFDPKYINADLTIDTNGLKNTRQLNKVISQTAYKGRPNLGKITSAYSARVMNKRANVTLNPITRLSNYLKAGSADTLIKAKEAMRLDRSKEITTGTRTVNYTSPGNNRESGDGEIDTNTQEIDNNRNEIKDAVNQSLKDKTPDAVNKLTTKLAGGGAALAAIGFMCGAKDISATVSDINAVNKIGPQVRLAADMVSTGSKIQDGKDIDAEGLGIISEGLTGKDSSWVGSSILQYETNGSWEQQATTFNKKPEYNSLIPSSTGLFSEIDSWFEQIDGTAGVGATVNGICTAYNTASNVLSSAITFVLPFLGPIQEWFGQKLLSFIADEPINPLDPIFDGEARGEMLAVGARMYANGVSESNGGRVLSDAEEIAMKNQNIEYLASKQNNIFSKITDLSNPYSPASSLYATALNNDVGDITTSIPDNIASSLTNIISKSANAETAPSQVYYGIPKTGFTKIEENPYELASWVANNITPGDETTKLFYDCHKVTVTDDFRFISESESYLDYDSLKPECKNDDNQKLYMLRQLASYTDVMETGVGCVSFDDDEDCTAVYDSSPSDGTTPPSDNGGNNPISTCSDPDARTIYWPLSPHPYNNTHDFGVPVGTPVYAITSGTVTVSKDLVGCDGRKCGDGMYSYGRHIKIDHDLPNGSVTYAHLQRRLVEQGDKVAAGQIIGYSGESGNAYGAHLHVDFNGSYTTIPWLRDNNAQEPPCQQAYIKPLPSTSLIIDPLDLKSYHPVNKPIFVKERVLV